MSILERGRRAAGTLIAVVTVVSVAGCDWNLDLAGQQVSPGSLVPSPSPSIVATGTPEPTPSASPTPIPTPPPSPTPIPRGTVGEIDLAARTCPGGVVLEWSALHDPRFHHYTVLRSPQAEIDPSWPPVAPGVDWGTTFATDPFVTTGADASVIPGPTTWNYRAMAYDARNRPIAASPVRQARLDPVGDIGPLRVRRAGAGLTRLRWQAFEGRGECFSAYVLLASQSNPVPTHGPGTDRAVISRQDADELLTDALEPGATYHLRVQAIRRTPLDQFVVAETAVVTYTVP